MSAQLAEDIVVSNKVGGNIVNGTGFNVSTFYNILDIVTVKNDAACTVSAVDIFGDGTAQWNWNFRCDDVLGITDAFNDVEMYYSDGNPVYDTLNYNSRSYPALKTTALTYALSNVLYQNVSDYQKPFTLSFIFEVDNIVYGDNPYQGHVNTGTTVLGISNLMNVYFSTDNGGSLKFGLFNQTSNFSYTAGTTGVSFQPNVAYHVTVTVDTSIMRLYIDGVERATGSTNTIIESQYAINVAIGTPNGVNQKTSNFRIIKRAVSAAEALQLSQETV